MEISDSVPLFHSNLTLLPPLEIAHHGYFLFFFLCFELASKLDFDIGLRIVEFKFIYKMKLSPCFSRTIKWLSIVGYFYANERFSDVELVWAKNLGDHIYCYFPFPPIKYYL
ncbi:unnamed protein product [Eruca vesicaria subsp. sativa]|uniref:Uncharacterized protein n=1 Tax=Eruca vesicaria subsp. sativa TaxID=29727 RepID=A0ABC8KN51_ERUVS|nr:unnamed protein product [Eruca vesicaria subsp. sativa]